MSPSTLSEEGRRELIARQHRALYGPEGSTFSPHGSYNQESGSADMNTQNQGPGQGMRGASPRGMDPFGMPQQADNNQQQSAEGKTTSPQSHQQTGAPSPPSGDDSGHARTISKSTTAPNLGGMGPIGSRPNQQHMSGQSLNKRTTSPLPTSISYGNFGVSDQSNDRNSQSQSGAGQKENSNAGIGSWGPGSGVWGNKIGASVWS